MILNANLVALGEADLDPALSRILSFESVKFYWQIADSSFSGAFVPFAVWRIATATKEPALGQEF